jgi:voltage-gated potassium channel
MRFQDRIRRGVARRGAFPFLAGMTALLAVGAGALARVTQPDDFHSFGDGVWWALVTLTTVGYGDIVPTGWGRVIGAFVMVLGVTFLSFLTATVTSLFVAEEEEKRHDTLRRIEERLARIEEQLAAERR